jgi:hypothetical protein
MQHVHGHATGAGDTKGLCGGKSGQVDLIELIGTKASDWALMAKPIIERSTHLEPGVLDPHYRQMTYSPC